MTSAREDLARSYRAAILATVERLPVSVLPDEGAISSVDNSTRHMLARFKNGAWVRENGQPLPFEPTFWLRLKK